MYSLGDISLHYGVMLTHKFISEKLEIEHDEKEGRSFKYGPEKVMRIGKAMGLYHRDRADDEIGKKPPAVKKVKVDPATAAVKEIVDEHKSKIKELEDDDEEL